MGQKIHRRTLAFLMVLISLGSCTSIQDYLYDTTLETIRDFGDLERKTVDVEGMKVTYLERRGGPETIVLVHGYAGFKDHWALFARHLPEQYRIIILDLPGHGDSAWDPRTERTLEGLSSLVNKTLETLDLEPFHLVGHSLGGYLSILYTISHPDQILTLGLFNAAAVFPQTPSDLQIALDNGIHPLKVETEEDFDRYISFGFYKTPFWPKSLKNAMCRDYQEKNAFYMQIWNSFWYDLYPLNKELREVSQPVLILWGQHDRILDISTVGVLDKLIADNEIAILNKAGHGSIMERPRESAILYADFLHRRAPDPTPSSFAKAGP